ncbi:hypothetical protein IscW_ISCW012422 [Ixodes scapularis]|uniref:Uncharacterized protein n=1 Tax=Ixodes scapularis TaxID=6945 RepID=B7QGE1_IXOSC|nr:hypothetical protein IscW_ISCW012422 [Ixodes scapularis]|eukprot:XP_002401512.1 hypothetical protein IscW_ISCW012422 [Ixodes scapularis]
MRTAAVLDQLRLTPGKYRKRFGGARKRKDEGRAQFASRTARYFSYYLEARSAEIKKDLIHLMVADQLLPGLYSHVSKYHSQSEDLVGFFGVIGEHMDGSTGKLRVVSQVPPRQNKLVQRNDQKQLCERATRWGRKARI